jgi:hypothetical protein
MRKPPAARCGSAGPAGVSGPVAGYQIVQNQGNLPFDDNGGESVTADLEAYCPAGTVAVGGGGEGEIFDNNEFHRRPTLPGPPSTTTVP